MPLPPETFFEGTPGTVTAHGEERGLQMIQVSVNGKRQDWRSVNDNLHRQVVAPFVVS